MARFIICSSTPIEHTSDIEELGSSFLGHKYTYVTSSKEVATYYKLLGYKIL